MILKRRYYRFFNLIHLTNSVENLDVNFTCRCACDGCNFFSFICKLIPAYSYHLVDANEIEIWVVIGIL